MSNLQIFNQQIQDERTQNYLQSVLGERKNSFVSNLTSLVGNSFQLQQCEPMTLMYSAMKATALNLPLDSNLGYAYVIPYNSRNGVQAQFQIGYKGFIQLALRSGLFTMLNVTDIREGEVQEYDILSGAFVVKGKDNREALPIVGYASYFKLTNGYEKTLYMTVAQLNAHGAKFSKTYGNNNGLWKTDFDTMARKTVVKLLLNRWAPLSVEMAQAVQLDQSVMRPKNGDLSNIDVVYADNEQSEQPLTPEQEQAVDDYASMADMVKKSAKEHKE